MQQPEQADPFAGIFPGATPVPEAALADVLDPGERVLWQGHPTRFGQVHLSPLLVAAALVYLVTLFLAERAGTAPAVYAAEQLTAAGEGTPAVLLWLSALLVVAALLVVLRALLRNPRRVLYAITERRALVLHDGCLAQQRDAAAMTDLMLVQGPEREMRGIGHLLWEPLPPWHRRLGGASIAGFTGIPAPEILLEQLVSWQRAATAAAAQPPRAPVTGDNVAESPESASRPQAVVIDNPRYPLRWRLPADWAGECWWESSERLRVLGLNMGVDRHREVHRRPLSAADDADWNRLEITNARGDQLRLWLNDGRYAQDMGTAEDELRRYGLAADPLERQPDLEIGGLWGFGCRWRRAGGMERWLQLSGEGWHLILRSRAEGEPDAAVVRAVDQLIEGLQQTGA